MLPSDSLPRASSKTVRTKKRSKPKTRRSKTKKTTRRGRRKGKLTPGLIKGMKALLKSTNPRVSAAMKAGIRRKLREEGVR